MAIPDYQAVNKANWDERAPEHAKAKAYKLDNFKTEPNFISDVVAFDLPLLGDISGLDVVHLQCHIGTDTLSLARRGAKSVVGLDFSPASLSIAHDLVSAAAGGDRVRFVESTVYDACKVLEPGAFDLVFTGIGALCWLPDIRRWAEIVASLLKPGGRLFLREGHPILWSIDENITDNLVIDYPYFEVNEPLVSEYEGTYVAMSDAKKRFVNKTSANWNHGLGEIVQALLDAGISISGLIEHTSIPWRAVPTQMVDLGNGEFALAERPERLPLTYTLQAKKVH